MDAPLTMATLILPQTRGCLVCGRSNPHGLRLTLQVDPATSQVTTTFTPRPEHIGFENIIHGGLLATVLDEAMVWSSIWSAQRACVAAELTIRYRAYARPGDVLRVVATFVETRHKSITVAGQILRPSDNATIATASGKFIPLDEPRHQAFLTTFLDDPASREAAQLLRAVTT